MNISALLQYDRAAILQGEVWRLITGHFVHWTPSHLAWDLLAFIVLGAICLRRRWLFASVVMTTALIVSTFLLVLCPEVTMYRGLSSIDSALGSAPKYHCRSFHCQPIPNKSPRK